MLIVHCPLPLLKTYCLQACGCVSMSILKSNQVNVNKLTALSVLSSAED